MIRLAEAEPWILPMLRLQVHDEIVLSVPVDAVGDVRKALLAALQFEWLPTSGYIRGDRPIAIVADVSKPAATWAAAYQKG